jgi:hypothetical protein
VTRFGIVGLSAVFVLLAAAIVKADDAEVRAVLAILAAVLLGAVIAIEARHRD